MRVLVTGAAGFIGRATVSELLKQGHTATALVRPGSPVPDALRQPGVEVFECDLRRPAPGLPEQVAGCQAMIHLASSTGTGWRAALENMLTGTENLLDAIRQAGWAGRFVHVSSFAVYAYNQMKRGDRLDEDTPIEPEPGRRDVYAWGKTLQERLITEARDNVGLDAVIVRPGAVYGSGKQFQWRLGRPAGDRAVIVLGGRSVMPLTYVENTASLLVECARNPAASGQVFNCVDPGKVTQMEYARHYAASQPSRMRIIRLPFSLLKWIGHAMEFASRRTDGRVGPIGALDPYIAIPSFLSLDFRAERADDVLGWRPPVSTPEALRRTFES